MGRPKLQDGDVWDSMRCVSSEVRKIRVNDTPGSGVYRIVPITFFKLRCACGEEMEVTLEDFCGKRFMPDCGCGIFSAQAIRPSYQKPDPMQRTVATSISIPYGVLVKLDEIAFEIDIQRGSGDRRTTRSSLASKILTEYIESRGEK